MERQAITQSPELVLTRIGSVSRTRLAAVLAEAFDDQHPNARAAWRATLREDILSARCCSEQSCLAMMDGNPVGAALVYGAQSKYIWRIGALGTVAGYRGQGVGAQTASSR